MAASPIQRFDDKLCTLVAQLTIARRTFLKAVVAAAGSTFLPAWADDEPLRFVVIADTHLGNGKDESLLDQLIPVLAKERPAFILHAGDVVHDTVAATAEVKAAERLFAKMPAKVFVVPGNHDIADSRRPALLLAWAKTFGPSEAVLRHPGWRIIGFNSSALTIACGDKKQRESVLAFLEHEVGDAVQAGDQVVMLHHLPEVVVPYRPQWQAPWTDDAGKRYEALLTKAPNVHRIAGHWHIGVRVPSVAGFVNVAPAVSSLRNMPRGYLRCVATRAGGLKISRVIVEDKEVPDLPEIAKLFQLPKGELPE
jgi:predicted phosphodiesterase